MFVDYFFILLLKSNVNANLNEKEQFYSKNDLMKKNSNNTKFSYNLERKNNSFDFFDKNNNNINKK